MVDISAVAAPAGSSRPVVRHVGEADLKWALGQGWSDFLARRGDFILLPLIYPLAGFAAFALALNQSLLPMLFPAVAGLSILGPAAAAGFYELARRREAGLDSTWAHFVDPLKGRSRIDLGILTAGLIVLFALWLVAAFVIFRATLGVAGDVTLSQFLTRLVTTPQGWALIVVGNLVGFAFAVATLCLTLVSFPIIVDRPAISAAQAVATSVRAVRENPTAAAAWGLRVAILLVLGCVPLFLGLPIVLPVLGYASWHLYTRLVVR
jgi:uncharacterized membrane protein